MRLSRILILATTLTIMLTGCKGGDNEANANDVPANPIEKDGYELIFSDEFDEEKIDTKKWLPQYFPHSTTVASACQTTYRMEDGKLCLYIDENTENFSESTEMKVSSMQTFEKNLLHPNTANVTNVVPYESFACQYGYFEMRAKMPDCGGGGHVAWWLVGTQDDARADGTMSSQNGEIDIMETTFENTNVFAPKVHAWNDEDLYEYKKEVGLEGTYDDSYHIYAMDWTPEGLTFYVDGKKVCETKNSPQYRMCMFLGIYTDCVDFTGAANSVYPKEFYVDYVRVYQDKNGYPNGVTKDATPVVLEKDLADQYESEMLGDEQIAESQVNLLSSAKVTLNGKKADVVGLCDGDYTYGYVSPDTVELPDKYVFTWDSPISADTLRISVNDAIDQAPTYMIVQTKSSDGKWKKVGNFNVTWKTASEQWEYVDIPLKVDDAIALRITVKDANLTWKHYVISELKLFKANDPEYDNAKRVTAVNAGTNEILMTNIAYLADSITSSGKGTGIMDIANEEHIAGYVSEDNPSLPQDITFNFDTEHFDVKGVRLSCNCGLGQAPTMVEVSVKKSGKWKSMGNYVLTWKSETGFEYCDLGFGTVKDAEGVKVTVKRANLTWKHYAIQEIQIY